MDDHESRQGHYDKKKFHQNKHKKVKETLSEEEEYTLKQISSMSAKPLLNFIEDKYEKLTGKNEKLLSPINNEIIKRIPQLKEEFREQQKNKIFQYIAKHTDRELKEDEKKRLRQHKWGQATFETKPKTMIRVNHHKDFQNEPNQRIQHFYFGNNEEEYFYEITFKRMKKEAVQILSKFIDFEAKVNQLKYTV